MNKNIFLILAVAAIGMYALPQSVSMFSGQHNFYDTIPRGSQVPCEKCHADINIELSQTGGVNAIHKAQGCVGCHITALIRNGETIHSAGIPLCIDCHDGSFGRDARGIFASNDAHNKFASGANTSKMMKGSNEACIACHTHTAVNITWVKSNSMDITVDQNMDVINISASGTATFTTSG